MIADPKYRGLKMYIVSLAFCFLPGQVCYADNAYSDTTGSHEITIYVIAPAAPISWESPARLYHSVKKSFLKKTFNPQKRFLGHMAFSLKTSLLKDTLWVGIVANSHRQMLKQLFFKKSGLGVLGFPFRAKIEDKASLKRTIRYHARSENVSFVTYRINEAAAKRILEFLSFFQKKFNDRYAPSDFYGGAFWPLYENEGAGCSALCMAALQAGNIPIAEIEEWKTHCKIPLSLVGGDVNKRKKIKLRSIRKSPQWYNGNGKANSDYIDFEIYDPARAIRWIREMQMKKQQLFQKVVKNNIEGLYRDCSDMRISAQSSLIENRVAPSLFIQYYKEKLK